MREAVTVSFAGTPIGKALRGACNDTEPTVKRLVVTLCAAAVMGAATLSEVR